MYIKTFRTSLVSRGGGVGRNGSNALDTSRTACLRMHWSRTKLCAPTKSYGASTANSERTGPEQQSTILVNTSEKYK